MISSPLFRSLSRGRERVRCLWTAFIYLLTDRRYLSVYLSYVLLNLDCMLNMIYWIDSFGSLIHSWLHVNINLTRWSILRTSPSIKPKVEYPWRLYIMIVYMAVRRYFPRYSSIISVILHLRYNKSGKDPFVGYLLTRYPYHFYLQSVITNKKTKLNSSYS